jgi:two-component system chemotaxis response regulator CheY
MLKVLVVEDTATFRMIIRRQFAAVGIHQVAMAADGSEALDLVEQEPDFDLILCDWHMAPMDGLTFCAKVQERRYISERRIPILFMTGDSKLADPNRRARALAQARGLGIVDIITKPFNVADLREVLARGLGYSPW